MDISEDRQTELPFGLRTFLDLVPVPSLMTDRTGVLSTANRAWTELTGLDRIGSMGIGWMRVLCHKGRSCVLSAVRKTASDGLPLSLDTELVVRGDTVPARFFLRGRPLESEPVVIASVVVGATRPPVRPTGPSEHRLIEDADAVIRDLFSVGITLESCAEHLGTDIGLRLHGAVTQLDCAINRLRRAALDSATATWPTVVAREAVGLEPRRHHPCHGQHDTLERLLTEARLAVEMCERTSPSSANGIEVVDSIQSLHRAIVGLAEAVEPPAPEVEPKRISTRRTTP